MVAKGMVLESGLSTLQSSHLYTKFQMAYVLQSYYEEEKASMWNGLSTWHVGSAQ